MIPQKAQAAVQPAALKNHFPNVMYRPDPITSRENTPKEDFSLKERLTLRLWQLACMLQDTDLGESEKVQGWSLFDAYLRQYVDLGHGEDWQ